MRRFLLLLLALSCFLLVPTIKAQEVQRFSLVLVEIWPEFDQPEVLVIFHIQLPDDVTFPAQIALFIPESADIFAVANEDSSGGLIYTDYATSNLDGWIQLLITAKSNIIQVEYYQPLTITGNQRQIDFKWIASGPVDEFSLIFQNPINSSNVRLNPESVSSQLGKYDLIYNSIQSLSLEANQIFQFTATYEKPDNELSIANLPVESEIPLEDSVGQTDWNSILPWIIGGIGLLLIGIGIVIYFGFIGKPITMQRSIKSIIRKKPTKEQHGTSFYCHECGRRAEEGDQFCRSCGVKLRNQK